MGGKTQCFFFVFDCFYFGGDLFFGLVVCWGFFFCGTVILTLFSKWIWGHMYACSMSSDP